MSDDKVMSIRATEVPGMTIEFEGPIGPGGLGLGYRVAVDQTIDREDLDELLDRIGAARRRQQAIVELPLERQRLAANLELLEAVRRDRATHIAQMNGRIAQLQTKRRGDVTASPQDVNSLSQHDDRVAKVEGQIAGAKAAIPYLEAVIRGEDVSLLDSPPVRMAAE